MSISLSPNMKTLPNDIKLSLFKGQISREQDEDDVLDHFDGYSHLSDDYVPDWLPFDIDTLNDDIQVILKNVKKNSDFRLLT